MSGMINKNGWATRIKAILLIQRAGLNWLCTSMRSTKCGIPSGPDRRWTAAKTSMICGDRPTTQTPVVITHRLFKIAPLQKWFPLTNRNDTWYGNWPRNASWPLTIRFDVSPANISPDLGAFALLTAKNTQKMPKNNNLLAIIARKWTLTCLPESKLSNDDEFHRSRKQLNFEHDDNRVDKRRS